ncbi:NUDIX domain-containing protein [Thioclava sp. GXIMD4216]|uniref:NUDIX hydrolase n=1 Tax=unclassified Thioclava TaxID=2621713 RepID=UPI0030CAA367
MIRRLMDVLGSLLGRRPAALQVAALCTRGRGEKTEVLLITSRGTGRWVTPKGWPMRGRSLSGAAAQEAWEEAGARGRITERAVGHFTYDKGLDSGLDIAVEVAVFHLSQAELSPDFPEAGERERRWFAPEAAAQAVAEEGLSDIILSLTSIKR